MNDNIISDMLEGTPYFILSRKALSLLDSVANMLYDGIQRGKNDVLLANYAKQSVQPRLSPLRPKSEKTVAEGLRDMTSI